MAECNNNDGLLVAEQFYNAGGRIIGREITNANLLLGAGLYSNVLDLGSSNLPTAHAYILENKINPEDDKLVQFATPEIAGQGRFSYRTYDNGVFSNWVQLANTNDLNLDGVYVRLDGSNIAPGTYFPNLKVGDSEKWKNQTYLDQILNGYTTFLMAYNPVTDSWQPAPKGVVKAFLEIEISDIIGLQTALNNKVDLNGSNAVGALADAIARRHDPVTLGASSTGLSLSNQVLSIAAGYGITTTNQISQFTEAYNLRHTHGNKPILDTILTLNISQWVNDVPYASESWSNSRFLTLNDPRINNWETAFNAIGLPLSNLNTSDKTSLINAINEVLASSNAYTAGDHIFIDSNKRISAVLDIANPLRDKNGAARISVGSNTVTDDFIFYSRFSNYVDFSWRDASGNKHMSLNSGGVLRVDQLSGAGNRLIYADLSGSIFATNIDANDLATQTWVDTNFARKTGYYPNLNVGNADYAANWGIGNNNGFGGVSTGSGIDYFYGYNSSQGKGFLLLPNDFKNALGIQNSIILNSQVGLNNASGTGSNNGFVNTVWFDYNWANTSIAGSGISFGGFGGGYQTEIFAQYVSGGNIIGFRTRNDDINQWNPARLIWHDGNLPNPATETWVTNNFASNTALGNKVDRTGDTMQGDLGLSNNAKFKLGAVSDPTHFIWLNPINDYDEINVSTGFQVVNYATGNPLFRVQPSVSQIYNNLIIPNGTAPNHAVALGQLANYALLSQIPTNNNQISNGANYITSAALAGYALISQIPTDNAQLSNGAGYITAASLPTVNNGALTFSVSADFAAGAFNFSANQPGNTNSTLSLSAAIKSDIALGVSAYNSLGNYLPIGKTITINGITQLLNNNPVFTVSATVTRTVEALPPQGGGNIPIKMNKTRVSVEAGTGYQIDDGNFEGDELVIVPCGSSFDIGIDIRWMDSCMNVYNSLGFDALRPRYFWWSTNDNCWIDVTT